MALIIGIFQKTGNVIYVEKRRGRYGTSQRNK